MIPQHDNNSRGLSIITAWKITDYSRRKEDAISCNRPYFNTMPLYTSRSGYRIRARVYINGEGISFYMSLMKGQYDHVLQWPFTKTFSLVLLNKSDRKGHLIDTYTPNPDDPCFQRPAVDRECNTTTITPLFARHTLVERAPFLVDDTMYFTIIVHNIEK